MRFVVVTGMSGAGKSQAVNALEDIGYYCVDNMPPKLLVHFFQLRQSQESQFPGKIAIVVDSRGGRMFTDLFRGLEQLKQMVFLLKGQILYASAPLPEALETVGKRVDGVLGSLFLETAATLESQPGEPFSAIWRNAVSEMEGKTALSKSDRQTLENLGEHLGFLDRETQERTLLLYLEQVDAELQVLREHRQERCRLYTSLGVMGGLFLAVILV